MRSFKQSQLIDNINRFSLDSRIGKGLFSIRGSSLLMGERISGSPGYSSAVLDFRNYRHGDSVKDIDWKMTARTEKTFIRIREGYRQTDFIITVDGSGSMRTVYDSSHCSKFITALTCAYITGRIALKSRDRLFIRYQGENVRIDTESALMKTLIEIENSDPENNFWGESTDPGINAFIFSDFFAENSILADYLKNNCHNSENIFIFAIQDSAEKDFGLEGHFRFVDPESVSYALAESGKIRQKYTELYNRHYLDVFRISRSFGAGASQISTSEDPLNAFIRGLT